MHKYVSFYSFGKSECKLSKCMSKFHIFTQILQGNALFSGKITQQETILHDRRSRRSRLISSLMNNQILHARWEYKPSSTALSNCKSAPNPPCHDVIFCCYTAPQKEVITLPLSSIGPISTLRVIDLQ